VTQEATGATVCYRHPGRATRLSCASCGRPICVDCSVDAAVGQKCPECARPEGRNRVVDVRRRGSRFEQAPVSMTLLAACVAIGVVAILAPAIDDQLVQRFALVNFLVAEGEWWRLLTSAFLHVGLMHLAFNMYALYLFGPELEMRVGSLPFALLYAASAVGGGVASYLFAPLDYVAVGASGAIFGLFGAWLFVAYRLRQSPGGRNLLTQLGAILAINLALPLLLPNIGWLAHIGGLVTGIGIAALWSAVAVGRPDAVLRRSVSAGVVLVLLVAVTFVA
jgi:membrane associated rhomboid family serine protease